jgi:hypothetical protein
MSDKQLIPEDEEISFVDGDEDEEEYGNPLEDLLTTDDGDNIANGLVKAIDRLGRLLDTQNKILVKMYTAITAAKTTA